MEKVETYIEKIYRNFDAKDEETKILKEETKAHLLDEVEELKKQGLSEDESIETALRNFGSEASVIEELNQILKRQSRFFRLLKVSAIFIFIIASVFLSINLGDELMHKNENPFIADKNTSAYIFENIENKIKNSTVIGEDLKKSLTEILDEFNSKNHNGLYYIKIYEDGASNIDFEYKRAVPSDSIKGGHGGLMGVSDSSKTWKIYFERTDTQANYDYGVQQKAWDRITNRLPNRLGQAANYLFVVSGVLILVCIINKFYVKSAISR